jgi:hypothetical protein
MIKLKIPSRIVSPNGFNIEVENGKGVGLIDVFTGIVAECAQFAAQKSITLSDVPSRSQEKVNTAEYGVMTKGELLGDHV